MSTAASVERARREYQRGHFAAVANELSRAIAEGQLAPEDRVLAAGALLQTGRVEQACRIARDVSASSASPSVQSRCQILLGLAAKRSGSLGEARHKMQSAVRLAREAGDVKQEAWSQLCLFRLLAEAESQDLVGAVFGETRRLVTKAADPHLAAYLHDCVSLLEAQTGRLNEARRHLGIATSILSSSPNAWLDQVIRTSLFCVACLDGDVDSAVVHARRARELQATTGGCGAEFTIDINEAHLNLISGSFIGAFNTLTRVSNEGPNFTKLVAWEGLARLYLAFNQLDSCERVLRLISHARNDPSIMMHYTARWSSVSKIRLLMRRAQPDAALKVAREELQLAQAVGDRALICALTLLSAEALAETGNPEAAGKRLLQAYEEGALGFRENVGQFYAAAALTLRINYPSLSKVSHTRALRVWRRQKNRFAQIEFASRGGPEVPITDFVQDDAAEQQDNQQREFRTIESGVMVLEALCSAFDLSFDPFLVCQEITNAAEALGCGGLLRIVEVEGRSANQASGPSADSHAARLRLSDSKQLEIRCSPQSDELTNLILGDLLRLGKAVDALARAREDDRNRAALWPSEDTPDGDSLFVADEMRALAATARKVAPTTVPVLLTGETGTGKEILARAIHAASTRARAPFLPFNCAAGPRDMIDAQLFGHRRGAFTGALEHASGVVRAAAGGTLFLDEIGEAPLDLQPKLLRFLEAGEIHPVGEPLPLRVDVRVIAATNLDLDAAVGSGRFREDLFYRLHIVRLHLPPLRERRVEIPLFAQHYLLRHARELGKGDLRLAEETMEYLLLYRWPGNVRQLANEMRRLATLAETDAVLMPEHLSPEIVAARRTVPASERTLDPNEVVVRLDQPLAAGTEHLERAMLLYALKRCGGRVEETARRLGLSRKGLYLKRQRLRLDLPAPQAKSA